MRPEILILGQGLAGTLLGWELERARIPFAIADPGHAGAATSCAAGIISPITGRRLVKSWRIETLLPAAHRVYAELETVLGVALWQPMRLRRLFADERERATALEKAARGDLAPFVEAVNEDGLWVRHAARVDLQALIAAARQRWLAAGLLHSGVRDPVAETARHELVIDCTGRAAAELAGLLDVPWEFSKGEVLELAAEGLGLASGTILNRRHWLVPVGAGTAWVGATHEPGLRDVRPTEAARRLLEQSARGMLGEAYPLVITGQRAGVRVHLPDKRPLAGRHPSRPRLGFINGLGGKGALWAPMLARAWVEHLTMGAAFDPEIDVARFR